MGVAKTSGVCSCDDVRRSPFVREPPPGVINAELDIRLMPMMSRRCAFSAIVCRLRVVDAEEVGGNKHWGIITTRAND